MYGFVENEYLLFVEAIKQEDGWLALYESPAHRPIFLGGSIYFDGYCSHTFVTVGEELFISAVKAKNQRRPPCALSVSLDSSSEVSILWRHPPREHVLCVSYEFDEDWDEGAGAKVNWAMEGF